MERNISFAVNGSYISKDNTYAGIVGEGGATTLVISFDESWTGLTKKITFYDAQGQNPVAIILTVDYMQDTEGLAYAIPIPAEPLAIEGEMSFVVDGAKDGIRQRAFTDRLEVKYAPVVIDTTAPIPPTPSDIEQLQAEIDAMVGLFITYKTEAAASATAAAASQVSAANSAIASAASAVTAGEYADDVEDAKIAAEASAVAAAASALDAAGSETAAGQSAADAALSETAAANSAMEADGIYDDTVIVKTAAESARDAAITAKTAAETARTGAQTAQAAAEGARDSAITAKTAAETARTGAQTAEANAGSSANAAATAEDNAADSATASQSWAVGDTGTRTGENTNNAKYWSDQAALAAGGGVSSFNGRSGVVAPQTGDYTAEMVGADVKISTLTTQDAIDDADQMGYYDTSVTANRKTAWSNIKAKLKTYFDGIYATAAALTGDVTGHYHTADRDRANHSGTQTASTISDFAATVRTTVLTGLSTANSAVITAADGVLAALGKLQSQITGHVGSTSNPHSTTAAQVEAVPLAGGTMTGALTLPGNPTANLQAAPKQYVDNSMLYQKIRSIPDASSATAISIDVSDIDWSVWREIRIVGDFYSVGADAILRLNNISGNSYSYSNSIAGTDYSGNTAKVGMFYSGRASGADAPNTIDISFFCHKNSTTNQYIECILHNMSANISSSLYGSMFGWGAYMNPIATFSTINFVGNTGITLIGIKNATLWGIKK